MTLHLCIIMLDTGEVFRSVYDSPLFRYVFLSFRQALGYQSGTDTNCRYFS